MDVAQLRQNTCGLDAKRIHLNGLQSLISRGVHAAVMKHIDLELQSDVEPDVMSTVRTACERTATLLHCSVDEVSLAMSSKHTILDSIFHALNCAPKQRVLTHGDDVFDRFCDRYHTDSIPSDAHGAVDLSELKSMLSTRQVSAVVVQHSPSTLTYRNDIEAITRIAHEHDVLVVMDASETIGSVAIDCHQLDVDVLVATGNAFLRGPRGTALVYVKRTNHTDAIRFAMESAAFTKFSIGMKNASDTRTCAFVAGLGVACSEAAAVLNLSHGDAATRTKWLAKDFEEHLRVCGARVRIVPRASASDGAKFSIVAPNAVALRHHVPELTTDLKDALVEHDVTVGVTGSADATWLIVAPQYYNTKDEVVKAAKLIANVSRRLDETLRTPAEVGDDWVTVEPLSSSKHTTCGMDRDTTASTDRMDTALFLSTPVVLSESESDCEPVLHAKFGIVSADEDTAWIADDEADDADTELGDDVSTCNPCDPVHSEDAHDDRWHDNGHVAREGLDALETLSVSCVTHDDTSLASDDVADTSDTPKTHDAHDVEGSDIGVRGAPIDDDAEAHGCTHDDVGDGHVSDPDDELSDFGDDICHIDSVDAELVANEDALIRETAGQTISEDDDDSFGDDATMEDAAYLSDAPEVTSCVSDSDDDDSTTSVYHDAGICRRGVSQPIPVVGKRRSQTCTYGSDALTMLCTGSSPDNVYERMTRNQRAFSRETRGLSMEDLRSSTPPPVPTSRSFVGLGIASTHRVGSNSSLDSGIGIALPFWPTSLSTTSW